MKFGTVPLPPLYDDVTRANLHQSHRNHVNISTPLEVRGELLFLRGIEQRPGTNRGENFPRLVTKLVTKIEKTGGGSGLTEAVGRGNPRNLFTLKQEKHSAAHEPQLKITG